LFAAQLRLLNAQIKVCDKRIDELLDTHPDAPIFLSFPGVGPVVAATLIAEMGDDRSHYPDARVLLAEAGLSPATRASGRMHQVRFRYACNHRMRHAIDWWAFVPTREVDWASEAYEKARDRGQGKYRALAALAHAGHEFSGAAGPTTRPTTPKTPHHNDGGLTGIDGTRAAHPATRVS
jgi:transposase